LEQAVGRSLLGLVFLPASAGHTPRPRCVTFTGGVQ
jgi:hypothetical protein